MSTGTGIVPKQDITAAVIAHPERWQTRDGQKVLRAWIDDTGTEPWYPLIVEYEGDNIGSRTIDGRLFVDNESNLDLVEIKASGAGGPG